MSNTEALKIALTLIKQDRRALLESHAYPPGSLTIPANDPAADEALAQYDEAVHAIRTALAQPQPSAPSVEPVAWQNIQFGPEHHVPPTPAPTAQPAPSVKDSLTVQPAPLPARALTFDVISEAKQDAIEVFDAEGPETPQIVRDVIEYMASWLEVYAHKRVSPTPPQPVEPAP